MVKAMWFAHKVAEELLLLTMREKNEEKET